MGSPLPTTQVLRVLVSRTWLDSAVEARDEESLEAWLRLKSSEADEATVAFAKSYEPWEVKESWMADRLISGLVALGGWLVGWLVGWLGGCIMLDGGVGRWSWV